MAQCRFSPSKAAFDLAWTGANDPRPETKPGAKRFPFRKTVANMRHPWVKSEVRQCSVKLLTEAGSNFPQTNYLNRNGSVCGGTSLPEKRCESTANRFPDLF